MRTQSQFDTSPEIKRQIKIMMIYEDIPSQTKLFLTALDKLWGDKYPDLRKAIKEAV